MSTKTSVYDFKVQDIAGQEVSLERYRGRVLLVVNTASKCGFTRQYAGLERLYRKFHDQGFDVLAFPCNQFGHQEPGDEASIAAFCQRDYGVTFPLHAKIDVNGPQAHPLYKFLKTAQPGLLSTEAIKWNFTKFLIDRHGQPIRRYAPQDEPDALAADIEKALQQKP